MMMSEKDGVKPSSNSSSTSPKPKIGNPPVFRENKLISRAGEKFSPPPHPLNNLTPNLTALNLKKSCIHTHTKHKATNQQRQKKKQ